MKIEELHEILLVLFREGLNQVPKKFDYHKLVADNFEYAKKLHELSVLLASDCTSEEFDNNYDPGGEPDYEEKVIQTCLYHMFMLRKYGLQVWHMIKDKRSNPVEYGKKLAMEDMFSRGC